MSELILGVLLAATAASVAVFVRGCVRIYRTVRVGRPAPGRLRPVGARLGRVLTEALSHRRFAHRPGVRLAHWFVMVSFPVLVLTLVQSYGQIVDPTYALPGIGRFAPWEWLTEIVAWGALIGIVAMFVVRLRARPRAEVAPDGGENLAEQREAGTDLPLSGGDATSGAAAGVTTSRPDRAERSSRFFGSNFAQAYFVEATVFAVVACAVVLRALEYALVARSAADGVAGLIWHFPTTAWLGGLWADAPTGALRGAVVGVAAVKILVSLSWFVVVGLTPTMGVAWHRFLALVNLYARREVDGRPALGALEPVRVEGRDMDLQLVEELDGEERLGVLTPEDLTWKSLLDLATCTECGRCQEVCPAWATGKVLSPKLLVLGLRDESFLAAGQGARRAVSSAADGDARGHAASPAEGKDAPSTEGEAPVRTLVGDGVDPQTIWDCTMCGACVQACPVDIEHVDLIADLRRGQVLMEGAQPREMGTLFRKVESRGNPWGLAPRGRMDWAKGLDFEVPVLGRDVADASEVDYLFWVGCAGAYEDRAKRTTRAVAELLHIAGVRYAVLGQAETCSGDPARRAGNEVLFLQQAAANIEAFDAYGVQRMVVTCAHCFNTFAREYPTLGGRYEVVHHTQLLDRLVREGRLHPVPAADDEAGPVTYHDPCFLGRHNQVYSPPRDLLAAGGAQVVEMPRHGADALCCGAGGARAWASEAAPTVGSLRALEARGTGAAVVATGCPYCAVMLSDGPAQHRGKEGDSPRSGAGGEATAAVKDVALLLLDAVRRGESDHPGDR